MARKIGGIFFILVDKISGKIFIWAEKTGGKLKIGGKYFWREKLVGNIFLAGKKLAGKHTCSRISGESYPMMSTTTFPFPSSNELIS